jgi:hypothetical protein
MVPNLWLKLIYCYFCNCFWLCFGDYEKKNSFCSWAHSNSMSSNGLPKVFNMILLILLTNSAIKFIFISLIFLRLMEPSTEGNRLEENCHLLFYGNTVQCETFLYRGWTTFIKDVLIRGLIKPKKSQLEELK